MPRLFTTPREIDYFNDIGKEIIKDVAGQKVYYYAISTSKTQVHDVYEEAKEKVFADPIEIEGFVKWMPAEVRTNKFGTEYYSKIEVLLQSRDLIDREIEPKEGDFFSYGPLFFEITSVTSENIMHGQVEYETGVKLVGVQARKNQFSTKVIGPTKEKYDDDDAVQSRFFQQRGFAENQQGPTGDKRALVEQGVLEEPISEPNEISELGPRTTDSPSKNSFYGDDE